MGMQPIAEVPEDGGAQMMDAAHVRPSARLLVAAMEVDPAYRYLLPREKERAAGLQTFFEGNLRLHVPHRCIHVLSGPTARLAPP
jgi:hypothetical protein